MPYCPKCNEEFDEGMSACVNCGADLVDSPLSVSDDEGLEHFESVFVGPIAEAFEIKSSLEDEGFTVCIQSMDESQLASHEIADEGALVKILVPQESAESASERIEALGEITISKMDDEMEFAAPGLEDFDEPMDLDGDFEDEPEAPGPAPGPDGEEEPEEEPFRPAVKKSRKSPAKPKKKGSARREKAPDRKNPGRCPKQAAKTSPASTSRKSGPQRVKKASKKSSSKPAKAPIRGARKR